MQYLNTVIESQNIRSFISEQCNQKIIDIVGSTITSITNENILISNNSLDCFITEGDILSTYDNIRSWSSSDMVEYMEAVSTLISNNLITEDQKIELLEEVLNRSKVAQIKYDSMKKNKGKVKSAPSSPGLKGKGFIDKVKGGYTRGKGNSVGIVGAAKGVVGAGGAAAKHIRQGVTKLVGKANIGSFRRNSRLTRKIDDFTKSGNDPTRLDAYVKKYKEREERIKKKNKRKK
jgi:hypothetical protein